MVLYLLLPLPFQLLQSLQPLLLIPLGSLLLLQTTIIIRHPRDSRHNATTAFPRMPHLLHLGQSFLHGLHCGLAGALLLLLLLLLLLSLLLLLVFLLLVALCVVCRKTQKS